MCVKDISRTRLVLLLAITLTGGLTLSAQTDYTSLITNPSFEQNADGWEHKSMGAQGNSVFDIKDGKTYMKFRSHPKG